MSVAVRIAERIRELRVAAGYSPEQLGVYAGVTGSTIRSIEAGKKIPRVSTVEAIADALDLSFDDLLGKPAKAKASA